MTDRSRHQKKQDEEWILRGTRGRKKAGFCFKRRTGWCLPRSLSSGLWGNRECAPVQRSKGCWAKCGVKSVDSTTCVLTGLFEAAVSRGAHVTTPSMRGNHVVFKAISTTCLLLSLLLTVLIFFSHSFCAVQPSCSRITTLQIQRPEICTIKSCVGPTTRIQIPTSKNHPAGRQTGSPHSAAVPGHTQQSRTQHHYDLTGASLASSRPTRLTTARGGRKTHHTPPDCLQIQWLSDADGAFPRKSRELLGL